MNKSKPVLAWCPQFKSNQYFLVQYLRRTQIEVKEAVKAVGYKNMSVMRLVRVRIEEVKKP